MTTSKARLYLPALSGQATRLVFLGLLLLLWLSCKPRELPPPPPPAPAPSMVETEEGMAFYVWNVKLPGTFQDIQMRQSGANTWLPLVQIRMVHFTGPEREGFRPAVILLVTGERTQGDLAVTSSLEGKTDLGYWNIPLKKVRRLVLEHN